MSAPIFISYRRADSSAEAGRLHSTILRELGSDMVFMDTSSIELGTQWPESLQQALWNAKVAIVVIGPEWIRTSDEFGIRRIDSEDDWVRNEIAYVLSEGKVVLPIFVRGAKMPPADKLPKDIRGLTQKQSVEIRDAFWDHDIKLVTNRIKSITGITSDKNKCIECGETLGAYPIPPPEVPDPISDEKLEVALNSSLSNWKKVISPLPENPTQVRIEICRTYKFKSFLEAIEFMNQVAPGCEIALHHPRWENLWRSVRVYLSTWDIGHKVSDRDIQLAKYFDQSFSDFSGAAKSKTRLNQQGLAS